MHTLTHHGTQLIRSLLRVYAEALCHNFPEESEDEELSNYPADLGTAGCPSDRHAYASWQTTDATAVKSFAHTTVCSLEYSVKYENLFYAAGPGLLAASRSYARGQKYAVCETPWPDSLDLAAEQDADAGGPQISAPRKGAIEQIAVCGLISTTKLLVRHLEL